MNDMYGHIFMGRDKSATITKFVFLFSLFLLFRISKFRAYNSYVNNEEMHIQEDSLTGFTASNQRHLFSQTKLLKGRRPRSPLLSY